MHDYKALYEGQQHTISHLLVERKAYRNMLRKLTYRTNPETTQEIKDLLNAYAPKKRKTEEKP